MHKICTNILGSGRKVRRGWGGDGDGVYKQLQLHVNVIIVAMGYT